MDTSTASRLSAAWVGTAVVGNATSNYSAVKVSMSTSFGVNDSYFVTTVTLQNLLSVPLRNVSWMRNVDPDQEQVRRQLQTHTEWVACAHADTGGYCSLLFSHPSDTHRSHGRASSIPATT